ncbi:MAG: hypothetical protein CMJ94_02845 [Planctomycetes bacterium]|nr:hypothetical protein [Planctomycetota bacterium]
METSSASPRQVFGLLETTVIVIVIGITALFAIPRVEARTEAPVVRKALQYAEWIAAHQTTRMRKGEGYSEHLAAFHDAQGALRPVPEEFTLTELKADGRRYWELVLTRREHSSSFGAYTIVFDSQGLNTYISTVPRALLPERYLHPAEL